ncbi:GAA [Cordylochernes scorpioides]|uniref:GAA n=1 Tax=Cordylochernes scorpioides TaxID=51811 RepID=A0ABY6KMQ0_9ARAC|nr:GAA [Cordylochernes scorpioides]
MIKETTIIQVVPSLLILWSSYLTRMLADVILQPAPAITFRPIGGILHFLILPGKSSESYTAPHDVSRKLTAWIGRPELPPYWSLGFHLCRFGYKTLNNTAATLERNRNANIPVDVQWNDIDYMVRQNDFTYDPARFEGLPQFVEQLHRDGLHYVIITDPGISGGETPGTYPPYDDGLRYNVFLKNSSGQLLIGKVWNPKSTVYPDFTHPNITDYWRKQIADFHSQVGFDGLWIDMNEPSNFVDGSIHGCPNTGIDHPPYLPQDTNPIYHKTACMSAQHYAGLHYNLHNLYGIAEAQITNM